MTLATKNLPVSRQDAAAELLARRRARTNLLDFTLYTFPDYKINWHHQVVCKYLDLWVAGEIPLLMVFMPPRHGKSELVSRRLPAYILGQQPDAHIITASYSADLASTMNRDVQRIIDSPEYGRLFPETRLFGSNIRTVAQNTYLRNSDIFEVVGRRGMYRSAGVGGGITGMGFNYGIVDDPLKNRKEARSPTVRQSMWDWWLSTFLTRREKDAGVLLTMTRWDMDDLAGRELLLSQLPDSEQWVVLSFPAVAEEGPHPLPLPKHGEGIKNPTLDASANMEGWNDPREVGEALWSWKYDLNKLEKIRKRSEYEWHSMYQQRPIAAGGGTFKRDKFKIIEEEPRDIVKRVRFWDLALSGKTSADYTVGVLMGLTRARDVVVLDVRRFQVEWDEVPGKLTRTALDDGSAVRIGIEAAFYQTRAVKKLLERPELHNFSVRGYKPDGDKIARAAPFADRAGEGMVYVLRRAWTEEYLSELSYFTGQGDAHDDQVDASAGAYLMLDSGGGEVVVESQRYA